VLAAALLAFMPGVALAQTTTQAALIGRLVDPAGQPLPGVTITVRSPSAAMAASSTVTDASGRYRLSPLPPGNDYLVIAALPGFARMEVGPVNLDPGKTTSLDLTLIPASETTQVVTVIARGQVVDVASTKTATVFDSEFIEGLPLLGRSYQDILTLAPGVTDVDGDGNPNVNGARDVDMQTRLDGANVTDPFSGKYGQNLNLESIGEIEMITTGASAEFGQAQGGFANVVTKSGSNEFEGSAKLFFRADLFDNDGANNSDVSDRELFSGLDGFEDFRPFVTLGGPIARDRVWYFVALEYLALEEPVNTLTFPALRTEDGWNNFGKVTWQATPSHRLSLQLNADPRRFTGLNIDTRTAPESDYTLERGGYSASARWTWSASPTMLLETMVSRLDTSFDVLPGSDPEPCLTDPLGRCDPFHEDLYTIDIREGTTDGPYYQTSRDTRRRDALRSDLSWYRDTSHGSHNLKGGFELSREDYTNQVRTAKVRFDDFEICKPIDDINDPFDDPIVCDPDIVVPGALPGQRVVVGSINFEESIPANLARSATKDNYSLYLQDSYKPVPNLTVNVGLRFDREEAQADGWAEFDPVAEATEFLNRLALGMGVPVESLELATALRDAVVVNDVTGDGKDPLHCGEYDLDGSVFGDGQPDGVADDFFAFYDGDFDGVATPGDPDDIYVMTPDGISDGRSIHPECDRLSEDGAFIVEPFSRHQLDPVGVFYSGTGEALGTDRTPEPLDLVNNNVAPRLSLSWDPWRDNRTKVFATWGRYFDRLFLATLVPEQGPDPRTVVYYATDREDGADAFPIQTGRFSITQVDRGLKTPFSDELTLGIERELAPEWAISATWIHRTGRNQLQDTDVNHYLQDANHDGVADDYIGRIRFGAPGGCRQNPGCTKAVWPDGQADLHAYNPFFNQILQVGNSNSSDFESLQIQLNRRLSRNWQMASSYVWSRAFGDAEEFLSGLGNDPGTVEDESGPLAFDQSHVVKFSGMIQVPHAQTVGGTVIWASGTPYSTIRRRQSADGYGSFYFRTTYPSSARNDQRNEGAWTVNVSYRKAFHYRVLDASVGVEAVNLLNADDLVIESVEPTQKLGLEATRRFGRRWQLSMALNF